MRKGYDGLFALARDAIGQDPLSGHLFLFVARFRKRAKVLFWDGTGLCVYMKRLEQGGFIAIWESVVARQGSSGSAMPSSLQAIRAHLRPVANSARRLGTARAMAARSAELNPPRWLPEIASSTR